MPSPPRPIVYIVGFNFYYGAVRNTPNKWLNFDRFFEMLRPHDDILAIKYFTAEIVGPTKFNQRAFLLALTTLPRVKIILGRFKKKTLKCEVPACVMAGPRLFDKPEEKRTDVNIAIEMLDDAYNDECDQFVLVSGDSDLAPAVQRIRRRFPNKRIIVYIPALQHSGRSGAFELRTAATAARTLPLNLLPRAQFPAQVPDRSGGFITKPLAW